MAQQSVRSEAQASFPAMDTLAAGMDTFASRVRRLGEFNSERLAKAREYNRHWMERAVAEAKLTMEMNSQLSSVHTLSDAMNICQQWANQRLKAAGDDVTYALSAGRELMEAASRALAVGANGSAQDIEDASLRHADSGSTSFETH